MPIYEYCCQECHHIFEEWHKDYTEKERLCPVCGAKAKRMISNTAFILKGSGWYATDYAAPASSSGNAAQGGNGNGDGKKEDQASTDSSQDSASSSSEKKSSDKTSSDSNSS